MVKEDLTVALKNALERGQSLEYAMQSLVTAGYSPEEVKESASYLNMGAANFSQKQSPKVETKSVQAPSKPVEQKPQEQEKAPEKQQPQKETQQTPSQQQTQTIYQKLPTVAGLVERPKRRIPKLFIVMLIILAILIIALLAFSFLGPKILDALFKK